MPGLAAPASRPLRQGVIERPVQAVSRERQGAVAPEECGVCLGLRTGVELGLDVRRNAGEVAEDVVEDDLNRDVPIVLVALAASSRACST
jgi:hypothetical protein